MINFLIFNIIAKLKKYILFSQTRIKNLDSFSFFLPTKITVGYLEVYLVVKCEWTIEEL